MKYLIVGILVFVLTGARIIAQSAGENRSGCKTGNLLKESPSTIDEMGQFLTELKAALAGGDKSRVARLAHYPLHVATAETDFTILSEQDFINSYNEILPVHPRELLHQQEPRCISRVGARGFTIGTGQIWFDKFSGGKVRLLGVTTVVYPGG